MPSTDLNQTTTTGMRTAVPDYSVAHKIIDEAGAQEETYYDNPNWSKYLGYFKVIPEFRQSVLSLAIWTVGKGYETDTGTKVILDHIKGWGEDTFQSIMQDHIIVKKVNGDAFAEIIRADDDNKTLLNLKALNPSNMRVVVNQKGLIIRYEEYDPSKRATRRRFKIEEIFHSVNDRIANEIHGTSVIESCQWVVDAKNEAMADWRRILHRSTIRVMYIDADDITRLNQIKTQYAEAIKYGELMLIPAKKGEAEFQDLTTPPSQPFMDWIRYLDNFFYQAVGVPKIIMGGSQEYTEASSKVGYLTFDPVYSREQQELESDLWNQLGIKVKFNRPAELGGLMTESEEKNTGQVGFQPNEVNPSMMRNE